MPIKQKRWWSFLLAPLLIAVTLSAVLNLVVPQTTYADYTPTGDKCDDGSPPTSTTPPGSTTPTLSCADDTKKADGTQDDNDKSEDEETCAIDKIGWILCPIIEQAAHISDKAFKILSDNFLRTDPQLFSNDSGTKTAWEYARNLANIMFIIAFLWIILSQVTGRGLDNYGIKKMLPRLIIAAVAVNVSYYICQIAVDITNILGYEIQNALADISNSLGPSVLGDASKFGADDKGGGILTVIAVGALAAAGVVFLILAPLGSIILFILITILTIIVILLLRKALIVLLIVISPIAFVLYLLPNTEKFFSKWMSMFGKLLMVFPIVGLLFGAGQLASTIIIVSGAQSEEAVKQAEECNPDAEKKDGKYEDEATEKYYNDQRDGSYNTCGGGAVTLNTTKDGEETDARTVSWMLGLVAAGIAVAPLIGVWAVLKGALSATGAIGGKISTAVQKGSDRGARGVVGAYQNSGFGKYRNRKAEERTAAIQAGTFRGRGGRVNPRNLRSRMNQTLNASDAFNRATGGFGGDRALMGEALNRKDSKEAMDMFASDDTLMSAWSQSGGDLSKVAAGTLDQGQTDKFKKMVAAGHNRKASSFLAAANYLSENGKGSASDVTAALANAEKMGASAAEKEGARQAAIVGYRKSGRADNLAALQAAPGAAPDLNKAFGDINAPSLNHGMFGDSAATDTAQQALNRSSYYGHLLADKGNTEKALRGFNQMDARTQRKIQQQIIDAARAHGATGATTVQDAKNHFGIQ